MKTHWIRNFLIGLIGALVIALGLSIFTATIAATSFYYSVTDLGMSDDFFISSYGTAINDAGQVLGQLQSSTGATVPFFWKNGKPTLTLYGVYKDSYVHGINNNVTPPYNTAQVVGEIRSSSPTGIPSGPHNARLWYYNSFKDLGTLENKGYSYAYDINDAGQIVGYASKSGATHAVLWDQVTMRDLGTLEGYTNSYALAINEAGQIVGSVSNSSGIRHAILWDKRIIKDLGTLEGYINSTAYDINSKDQVVGWNYNTDNSALAFLWAQGKMKSLGTLGGKNSYAYAINNRGQVVGKADTSNSYSQPFMWVNGKIRDLNSLIPVNSGWQITEARDINNKGQIIGTGRLNGQTRAVILTPTWVTTIKQIISPIARFG